jgi:hypothetical protein
MTPRERHNRPPAARCDGGLFTRSGAFDVRQGRSAARGLRWVVMQVFKGQFDRHTVHQAINGGRRELPDGVRVVYALGTK